MTDQQPPSPHPLGADAPTTDHVGLAFAGLAAGVSSGTALTTGTLWAVRSILIGSAPAATPNLNSPAANLLLLGTFGGVLLAAVVTWRLLSPVGSTYRQGGLSMVSGFATFVVSMVALPVDVLVGRWGLLGLSAVFGFLALRFARRARVSLTG